MERALALSYALASDRMALAALLALDDTLGEILRTTREPLVGQMRLTWWHAALTALDTAPPPAQPVLQALAADVLPRGVRGSQLAGMIEGWEVLLEPSALSPVSLDAYASARGAILFELAGVMLGARANDPLPAAGAGWALADLSRHARDPAEAAQARNAARPLLEQAGRRRWSRRVRPLGALALIAGFDLAASPPGGTTRVARLAWHRLTGR